MFTLSNIPNTKEQEKTQLQTLSSTLNIKENEKIQLQTFGIEKNSDIDKITCFYNKQFPSSTHSERFKKVKYNKPGSIVFTLRLPLENEIAGLIECWDDTEPGKKILASLAIDEKYRGQGYAHDLFNLVLNEIKKHPQNKEIIVHFRDSKKDQLQKIYKKLGFSNLTQNGKYRDEDIKWEMSLKIL